MEYRASGVLFRSRPQPERRAPNEKQEGPAVDKATETGLIVVLKDSYGFIKCAERDARLIIHYSTCRTAERDLNINDGVQFVVTRDARSNKMIAADVLTLPPVSVQFEERIEIRFDGVITQPLVLGHSKSHIEGTISYRDEEEKEACISYGQRDISNPRERLAEGDEVAFSIVVEKRTGKRTATEIKTTKVRAEGPILLRLPSMVIKILFVLIQRKAGKRELGKVVRRNDKYGFIRACEREGDIFFHISELPETDRSSLDVDQDVEFTIITDPRCGILNAIDIKLREKGSAVFDTIDETRLHGIVTKRLGDGRDSRKDEQGVSMADGAVEYVVDGEKTSLSFRKSLLNSAKEYVSTYVC